MNFSEFTIARLFLDQNVDLLYIYIYNIKYIKQTYTLLWLNLLQKFKFEIFNVFFLIDFFFYIQSIIFFLKSCIKLWPLIDSLNVKRLSVKVISKRVQNFQFHRRLLFVCYKKVYQKDDMLVFSFLSFLFSPITGLSV